MRILIIGSPGAGKSIFAKQLSEKLSLPLYHLDDYYWQKNWQRPSDEQWRNTLDELLLGSKWIIDGNYFETLERRLAYACHVIYLDFSPWLCLYRAFKRAHERMFHSKSSLPKAVKDDKNYKPRLTFNLRFSLFIALFKLKHRPKMMQLLQKNKVNYSIAKNPKEARKILATTNRLMR